MTWQPNRKLTLFVLAVTILSVPAQPILAANPQAANSQAASRPEAKSPVVHDIALGNGGVLRGQVVDRDGTPAREMDIRVSPVSDQPQQPIVVKTDDQGHFQIAGLQGGVHRVETSQGAAIFRLWAPNTAPPAAKKGVLIVDSKEAVRANLSRLSPLHWTLIGVGIAAAIAIPLALDDDDDDDDAS